MRALSSTPDKPTTRSRGRPVCLNARSVRTSTGLLSSNSIAFGACCITLSASERSSARLASRNWSRLMPGLRGRPAVMITSSEPTSSAGSAPPLTWVSKPNSGADSCMSRAMPRAMLSSMPSNTSSRHSDSFARICAVDSPTRPGPTMAIFFKATSFRTAHRDDERRRMFCKVGRRGTRQARRFFFRYNRRRALGRLREHSLLHAIQLLRLPLRLSAAGAAPVSRPAAARPRTRRGLHARGDVARLLRMVDFRERQRPRGLKRLLILGLSVNLAALGYYKYANFFVDNINALFGLDLFLATIVLPLGISFFTFQKIALLGDVYYGKVGRLDLLDYALFVAFFPQLFAGPIVHHSEMMPQFKQLRRVPPAWLALGGTIFVIGLAKKVLLADTAALYAPPQFNAAAAGTHLDLLAAWSGALAYTAQLYFDFSAYSDMAIGLGLLFGVRLPLNFASPYQAVSIIDFWRRWHMTLSRFLRDYLYI